MRLVKIVRISRVLAHVFQSIGLLLRTGFGSAAAIRCEAGLSAGRRHRQKDE